MLFRSVKPPIEARFDRWLDGGSTDDEFPDNQFRLNDTYGITKKSALFFYNDYEVEPRSATEVAIPYTEIRGLLRPGFVK